MARFLCALFGHRWYTTVIPDWIICARCLANFTLPETSHDPHPQRDQSAA